VPVDSFRLYGRIAERNLDAYRPYFTGTLNKLEFLYAGTQRLGAAEKAINEALTI
jgi:hypothetical protein